MAVDFARKNRYNVDDLLAIMALLRSEQGCPWDREQTHESIRKNFIEEVYEAVEAIDEGDRALLREELGDVLLQVVFHSRMEEERGGFAFSDVVDEVCKKLIIRHPHIFSDGKADSSDEVLQNWEAIKKRQKGQKTASSALDSVAKSLPALMYSQKVQKRAADAGFDYESISGAISDLESELDELKEAVAAHTIDAIDEELGDLIFAAVNVARFAKLDAEESLTRSARKFVSRFRCVERMCSERSLPISGCSFEELDRMWKAAKEECRQENGNPPCQLGNA